MDRPRLMRGLRIAWSVWWGILCVLVIVLWVRSYWRWDELQLGRRIVLVAIHSEHGRLGFVKTFPWHDWNGKLFVLGGCTNNEMPNGGRAFYCVEYGSIWVGVHYGLPVLLAATSAYFPWMRVSFSLRTLLIATSLIAVVLGLVVWAASA